MDLKAMDLKIDDEDHALVLLCYLPHWFGYFVYTILCGRDTTCMEVKDSFNSRKVKNKVFGNLSDAHSGNLNEAQSNALVVRGRGRGYG